MIDITLPVQVIRQLPLFKIVRNLMQNYLYLCTYTR